MKAWVVHKLLRGFNFFLLGLLTLVSIGFIKEWFEPKTSRVLDSKLVSETDVAVSKPSATDEVVFKEPIFAQAPPQIKADLPITFKGTASNGSKFFAVIEYQGRQSLVQVTDRVGAWTIQDISESDLILKNERGESIRVTREFVSQSPSSNLKKDESQEKNDAIKSIDQNHLELDQKSFQNILSHWADLLREIQILPYVEKGESKGYVILNIRQDGIVQKLGFRIGDIIEKINGREVTDLASLLVLFEPVTEELKVDIKRGPKRIQLVYQISKGKGNI